jgi:hypothetical protein
MLRAIEEADGGNQIAADERHLSGIWLLEGRADHRQGWFTLHGDPNQCESVTSGTGFRDRQLENKESAMDRRIQSRPSNSRPLL